MPAASLLSGLLSGGGGLSPNSSTAQSSPFYNDSGIYFDSPGAGGISGNSSDATATPSGSRQTAGGINALPSSDLLNGISAPTASGGNSLIYLALAGVAALAVGAYFLFKK